MADEDSTASPTIENLLAGKQLLSQTMTCSQGGSVRIMKVRGNRRAFVEKLGLELSEEQLTMEQWFIRLLCNQQNFQRRTQQMATGIFNHPACQPAWANGAFVLVNPRVASEVPALLKQNGYFASEEEMNRACPNGGGFVLKPFHVILSPQVEELLNQMLGHNKNHEEYLRYRTLSLQNAHAGELVWEVALEKKVGEVGIEVLWQQPHISTNNCPMVQRWNTEHPEEAIQDGDTLVAAGGHMHVDHMQRVIDTFQQNSNDGRVVLKLLRKTNDLTPLAMSRAESEMLRLETHVKAEFLPGKPTYEESAHAESHKTRSSGARPTVPLPGRNLSTAAAAIHFENPEARARDYGPTNKYHDKLKRSSGVRGGSPRAGKSHLRNAGDPDHDDGDGEHDAGRDGSQDEERQPPVASGDVNGGNCSGRTEGNAEVLEEHAVEVAESIASSMTLDSSFLGSSLHTDLLQLALEIQLQNCASKDERWRMIVDEAIVPWLDHRLSVDSIPMDRIPLSSQAFRDRISKLVRLEGCFDPAIIMLVFPESENRKLPFAKTFKQLLNKDFIAWGAMLPDQTASCAQAIKTQVIDKLHDILLQILNSACDSEEKELPLPSQPRRQRGLNLRGQQVGSTTRQTLAPVQEESGWGKDANLPQKWANPKSNPGLKDKMVSSTGSFQKPGKVEKSAAAQYHRITGKQV